jgi:hypothetical protein
VEDPKRADFATNVLCELMGLLPLEFARRSWNDRCSKGNAFIMLIVNHPSLSNQRKWKLEFRALWLVLRLFY